MWVKSLELFFVLQLTFFLGLQVTYSSELTKETQVYPRVCGKGNYHYETLQITVQQDGSYTFDSNTSILLYGYIYRNDFDPSYPNQNLLTQSNFSCGNQFQSWKLSRS